MHAQNDINAQVAILNTSTKQCKIISKTGKTAIANAYEGEFLLRDAPKPTELLKLLNEVEQNPYQSIILSTVFNRRGIPLNASETVGLTTKKRLKKNPDTDDITRSQEYLKYTNRQGYLLFDIDDGGTYGELVALFPELQGVGFVVVPSSSSFIFSEDGSIHTGAKGWHVYLLILNMPDAERIAQIMWGRMWLQGRHGNIKISKGIRPAMLERGLWDKCVLGAPERLAFEAKPELHDGLTRDVTQHRRAFDGSAWDTEKVPNLTKKEIAEIAEIIKKAKAEKEPERKKAVKEAKKIYIDKAEKSGKSKAEALRDWEMIGRQRLPYDFILHTEDGEREAGSLNADDDGLCMADPNEPEYHDGALCAVFYWNDGGNPKISSRAHGGQVYSIAPHPDDWKALLEQLADDMNQTHAQVLRSGKHRIVREKKNAPLEYIDQKELEKSYQNAQKFKVGEKKNKRTEEITDIFANPIKAWTTHPKSRNYMSVIFSPKAREREGIYNTWRGFAVEPIEAKEKLEKIQEHIEKNVCAGDPALINYFYDWNAFTFQHPEKPAGTAVVLVGEKGTGKGVLGHFIMKTWGVHAIHLSQSSQLVGKFNRQLEDACFVFADEAFFAGDKVAEGVLKSLITEPFLMIEPKGFDAFQQKNYMKVFMATNNEKAVPASRDERRFCVFNVSNEKRGDHAYFSALKEAMDDPAVQAAFLHEMLTRDITGFHAGKIPESEGLKEQRYYSLCSIGKWLVECLTHGEFRFKDESLRTYWQTEISTSRLYKSYEFYCAQMFLGKYEKVDLTAFGLYLNRVGFIKIKRRTKKAGTLRLMRSLPDAIELFQKYQKITIRRDVVVDADLYGCAFEPLLRDG